MSCSSSRQSSPSQMPDRASQPSLQHYRVREQEASFPDVTNQLLPASSTKRVTLRECGGGCENRSPRQFDRPASADMQRAKPHSAAAVSRSKRCTRDEGHQFQIRNMPDNFTPPTRRKMKVAPSQRNQHRRNRSSDCIATFLINA